MKDELIRAAMLGTRLQRFTPPATGTPLDSLLSGLREKEPAQQLLDTLAMLVAYEQAGPVTMPPPELPPPAPEDPRPRGPGKHLLALLVGREQGRLALVGEWLELMVESGKRPPEQYIAALLSTGDEQPKLRPLIRKAVGPLGEWLAPRLDFGKWMVPPGPAEQVWETGSLQERCQALQRIRDKDRAQARELLDKVWPKENAGARQQLLEAYATPPVKEDEDWLEAKLDDRSVFLRRIVADRLVLLPRSRLVERMKKRLAGRITFQSAVLFEELTEDMERDGIERRPSQPHMSEPEWWTMQALASIPPSYWPRTLKRRPMELYPARFRMSHGHMVESGWRAAAIRFRDQDWLGMIFEEHRGPMTDSPDLLAAMDPHVREQEVRFFLGIDPESWLQPKLYGHRWSLEFSQAYVDAAQRWMRKDYGQFGGARALREAAAFVSPDVVLPMDRREWLEMAETLALRREMREAIVGNDGGKHGE
ncbi:MAG: hypothetical protein JNK87_14315 [Bryobacterales bacterium]|nr:hypothetical protein [Bryobacterales bacterium]